MFGLWSGADREYVSVSSLFRRNPRKTPAYTLCRRGFSMARVLVASCQYPDGCAIACAIIVRMSVLRGVFPAIRFAMTSLWRLFIVLSLALLTAQGAFANEHATQRAGAGQMMQLDAANAAADAPSHCADMAASREPCRHDHSICCMATCGVHCAALFVTFRFEPRVPDALLPRPLPEPRHEGVTHVPPLRPPIA